MQRTTTRYGHLFANKILCCFVRRLLEQHANCEHWSFTIIRNRDGAGLSSSVLRLPSASRTVFYWLPGHWWPLPHGATDGRLRVSHISDSWSSLFLSSRRRPLSRWYWHTTGQSTCRRPSLTQRPSPATLQVRTRSSITSLCCIQPVMWHFTRALLISVFFFTTQRCFKAFL